MKEGRRVKLVEKFAGGEMSPNELHRALAFGGRKCDACGAPAAIQIKMFLPLSDVLTKAPEWAMKEALKNEGKLPIVEFKHGKHVRVCMTYACERCRAEAERIAVKAPSYCVVEIDEGPEAKNPVTTQSAGMPEQQEP
jgi:hypothetical protein